MHFHDLKHFIASVMKMSHVYQPVMLMTLIEKGGRASVRDIACSILAHDESQIEYYEQITKNMPGPVLRNRGVVGQIGQRRIEGYELLDFSTLSREQKDELVALCRAKLTEFDEKRGETIWSHRKLSEGYISGTIRYEVLMRAKFRCELCGVSADEKALEVDHIIPRNKGGSDDETNLQALCYSCNAMKRDTDDTDFRDMAESYKHRQPGCVFCEMPSDRIIEQNELCYAVRDKFPVTPGHSLVLPKRHVADFFGVWQPERNGINSLLKKLEGRIRAEDPAVTGFNIGMNCGKDAGQTVLHCHVHLIPRRAGDVADPAGGVRHVVPGMGQYAARTSVE
jgi:diadenosine tetraphosphate (Ap4A) HIT family hydrolase